MKMIKNKFCGGHALRIAVEITVLAILLFAGEASALSNSNGGNWLYFKEVTITNTGTPLNDYQVQVNLAGGNFPAYANTNGEDIRFTDANGTELSYWIENWDNSSKAASIWVKVPSIPTGSSTNIKMYYGNPKAISSSNGDKTFEFFDDFSGTSLDLSKWPSHQGEIVSNGILSLNVFSDVNAGDEDYVFATNFVAPIESITELRHHARLASSRDRFGLADARGEFFHGGYSYLGIQQTAWDGKVVTDSSDGTELYNQIYEFDFDTKWHIFKFIWSSGSVMFYIDNTFIRSINSLMPLQGAELHPLIRDDSETDWIFVRKYASSEPSISVSGEMYNVEENFTFGHLTDVHIGYYPNKIYCIDSFFISAECSYAYMTISTVLFTDTLQSVKKDNLSFILITGDLVQYDNKDFFIAFRNLLKGISIPVNATPGNHDRRDVITGDNLSNYNDYIKPISNPSTRDNNYFFDYKGYRFIGLDSGADFHKDPTSPEGTGLTDDQLKRLREDFNNSFPKIIFMHHPVMSSDNDSLFTNLITGEVISGVPYDDAPGGNNGAIAINRWNFINYTRDSNVKLVLTGHNHTDLVFDVSGNLVANSSFNWPLFIQTRSTTKDENNGRGYRIIEVKDGKVNPYDSMSPPRYIRNSGEFRLWNPNEMEITSRLGLHVYDFSGRHTGMKYGCNDFELGLPESYYTGDYGGSITPQVITGYTPFNEIKVYSCMRYGGNGANARANPIQFATTTQNVQHIEDTVFNLTLEKQREKFSIDISFHNINATESLIATVNVSDEVKYYIMDLDLNGDGTTDQLIYPDSIGITLAQPQNNIDANVYNGAGIINLASNPGYFIKAASLNASLINGEPIYDFPYGLLAFTISGLGSGQTINVTITLPQNLSQTARYWNYGATSEIQTPHWYRIPIASNNGDNVITIQLQDGGIGDDDLKANGIITSAGGPGIPLVGKVTGGGWIKGQAIQVPKNNNKDNKATFAFEARFVNSTPKGNLEYTDHVTGMKLHGDVTTLKMNKETATFGGTATINGTSAYAYTVTAVDKGESGKDDTFAINIPFIAYLANGTLGGGDIEIHDKESQDIPNFDRNDGGNIKIHDKD